MGKKIPSFFEYLEMQTKKLSPPMPDQNPVLRLGTVSAVSVGSTTCSVVLDGDTVAASYVVAGSYYPVVNDRVLLQKLGNTFVVMDSVGSAIKFASFKKPIARLRQVTSQTGLADGSDTVLTFGAGSTVVDNYTMHSESVNTTRITVPFDGIYRVDVQPVFAFGQTIAYCSSFLRKNGSIVQRSGNHKPTLTNNVNTLVPPITLLVSAVAGDYFEGGASFASSPAATNQSTNASAGTQSVLQAEWVSTL